MRTQHDNLGRGGEQDRGTLPPAGGAAGTLTRAAADLLAAETPARSLSLLPCPRCGAPHDDLVGVEMVLADGPPGDTMRYQSACGQCGQRGPWATSERTAAALHNQGARLFGLGMSVVSGATSADSLPAVASDLLTIAEASTRLFQTAGPCMRSPPSLIGCDTWLWITNTITRARALLRPTVAGGVQHGGGQSAASVQGGVGASDSLGAAHGQSAGGPGAPARMGHPGAVPVTPAPAGPVGKEA